MTESPRHPTSAATPTIGNDIIAKVGLGLIVAAAITMSGARGADAHSHTTQQVLDAQMFVYELNRARLPSPPLAISTQLQSSAGFKAHEMAQYNYISHQSPVTGIWPNRLAVNHGYLLPQWWNKNANYIESYYVGSSNPATALSSFTASPQHYQHLFGTSHREIGAGRATSSNGQSIWVVHTGVTEPARTFITGVVFNDANGDGCMNRGEGLGGVTVTNGQASATSNAGGGYALAVNQGTYTVTASGGGLGAPTSRQVAVGTNNVLVDFAVGASAGTHFADGACHQFSYAIQWMWSSGLSNGCQEGLYCPNRTLNRGEMATFMRRAAGLKGSENNGPFVDHLTNEHRKNINAIRIAGFTVGCAADRYCPWRTLTRAEIATLVRRATGVPPASSGPFTDVAGHWGAPAINAMSQAGIAWPCESSTKKFCPDRVVDRAEMAQWLYLAWKQGLLPAITVP